MPAPDEDDDIDAGIRMPMIIVGGEKKERNRLPIWGAGSLFRRVQSQALYARDCSSGSLWLLVVSRSLRPLFSSKRFNVPDFKCMSIIL